MRGHLSSHCLDEILVGVRDPAEGNGSIAQHLAACEDCCGRLAARRAEDEATLRAMPPERFAAMVMARAGVIGCEDVGAQCQIDRPRSLKGFGVLPFWRLLQRPLMVLSASAVAGIVLLLSWARTPEELSNRMAADEAPALGVYARGDDSQGGTLSLLIVRDDTLYPVDTQGGSLEMAPDTPLRIQARLFYDGYACLWHVEPRVGVVLLDGRGQTLRRSRQPWLVPGTFALTPSEAADYVLLASSTISLDCAGMRHLLPALDEYPQTSSMHVFRLMLPRAKTTESAGPRRAQ